MPGSATNLLLPTVMPAENTEGPMQCEVLNISSTPESHLMSLPDSESPANEAFHLLGVRLRHLRRQRPLKKVLITSTIPQEGKSMVAANLACTLAFRTQQKVLLLEGDIRRPTQSKIFGIGNKPGICEWLDGEKPLIKSVSAGAGNLDFSGGGRHGEFVGVTAIWSGDSHDGAADELVRLGSDRLAAYSSSCGHQRVDKYG